MDWKTIARVVAPLAPVAGSILGGLVPFPGASVIGQKFGELLAAQFGVPAAPAAVAHAITEAGEETARTKINAAVEMARVQIQGFNEYEKAVLHAVEVGLVQTGETMRAELGREHWFFNGWRPAIGWVFVLFALSFGVMLSVAAGAAAFFRNRNPLEILTAAWPIFLAYFGTLGLMVGVYISSRSAEKKTSITTATPMPNVPLPQTGSGVKSPSVKPPLPSPNDDPRSAGRPENLD
jgi:hypothetical protein